MQQDLMKKTAVGSIVFFAAAMAVIIGLSAGKVVTVNNVVAQDEVQNQGITGEGNGEGLKSLTFLLGEADTSYLRVPLPEGCKADDIMIENHYMDRELLIQLPNVEKGFYEENAISGNRKMIRQGVYEEGAAGCELKFELTGIYECRTILENKNLYISFLSPKEMYDKIVVIDPVCGGADFGDTAGELWEKDVNLLIARKLKEKLDGSDIKAYYTRMDDVDPEEEERVLLANETRADMYIRIQTGFSKDTEVYGTEVIYNGEYFIPGFGSVELADALEREVVTSIKGKALGLKEAEQKEYALCHATVPAAAVSVGYLSNKQEAGLLGREEYIDKIAEGIYQAILKRYEE